MYKLKIISIYIIAVIATACSINNKYNGTHEIKLPDKYINVSQKVSNKESLAVVKWENFFKDESVKNLIKQALDSNFNINSAAKNLQISEKYFRQSRLNYLPNINLAIIGNDTATNSSNKINNSNNFNTSLQISWEIDLWGKLKSNEQAMLAQYLQTMAGKQAVRAQIIAQTAKEYYHLYLLNKKLDTLKKYQSLADSTVQMMELQFKSGSSNYLSVQQSIAQQLTIKKMFPELEQNIFVSKNAISFLTGQFPKDIRTGDKIYNLTSEEYMIGIPADLLRYRPDIQQAEYALRIASAKANVNLKEMYPSLTVTASGGLQLVKNSLWFNIPNALFALAEGSIIQPLFNKRKLKTNYEIALLEREKAVINFKESVVNAIVEVSNALNQVNKLKATQHIVEHKVQTLTKAVKDAKLLFLSGLANYLEVITAQTSLINAELENIDLKEQYLNAVINLYIALGGGSID